MLARNAEWPKTLMIQGLFERGSTEGWVITIASMRENRTSRGGN